MLKMSTSPEMMQDLFAFYDLTKESLEKLLSEHLREKVQLVMQELFSEQVYRDLDIAITFNHKTLETEVYLKELRGKKFDMPKLLFKKTISKKGRKAWLKATE